eukprot:351729-Chlamydomonas_euryale.AAC.10
MEWLRQQVPTYDAIWPGSGFKQAGEWIQTGRGVDSNRPGSGFKQARARLLAYHAGKGERKKSAWLTCSSYQRVVTVVWS